MGKCSFRPEWLKKIDPNDCAVSEWARKHSETEAFCSICKKAFTITKGFQAIEQHANSAKHKELLHGPAQLRFCANQDSHQKFQSTTTDSSAAKIQPRIQLISPRDAAAKAELIWVLKCIASDFPAASWEGIRCGGCVR